MFATTKRIAVVALIAGAFNALLCFFILAIVAEINLTFVQQFTIVAYVGTTSALLITLSCALFGLSQDLEMANDSQSSRITELKKRVDVLEQR